jgi:ATP-dependent helicase YprA (DUF1998 family)
MPDTLSPQATLIFKLALDAEREDRREDGRFVAAALNANGLKTSYGSAYAGERGTYRMIRSAYQQVEKRFGAEAASVIAEHFVLPNGKHAWD